MTDSKSKEYPDLVADLIRSAAAGAAGRVSELLDRDAGLARAFGPDGRSALHHAAAAGHAAVVRRLLRRGVDPDITSRDAAAETPLHIAAAAGHAAIVKLLRDHGARAPGPRLSRPGNPHAP